MTFFHVTSTFSIFYLHFFFLFSLDSFLILSRSLILDSSKFFKLGCLVDSRGLDIWVSFICFQKSNISWPQQPPTEKVLKFNMTFHDSTKTFCFQNIKIKLNWRTWMTLKSSVVNYSNKILFLRNEIPRPKTNKVQVNIWLSFKGRKIVVHLSW